MRKNLIKILMLIMATLMMIAFGACDCGKEPEPEPILPPEISYVDSELAFNVSKLTVTVGDEATLAYKYTKVTGYKLSFVSSNEDIVTVDNYGNIQAKYPGTATITATYGHEAYKDTATCEVTVGFNGINPKVITADNLADGEIVYLGFGTNYEFVPKVLFNGKVYDDITFEAQIVKGQEVISSEITEKGLKISADNYGDATIEITAGWRSSTYETSESLKMLIEVSIIDKVGFILNNEPIVPINLYTNPLFAGKTFKNTNNFKTDLLVNGKIVEGADINIDFNNANIVSLENEVITATNEGQTTATLTAEYKGKTYSDVINISVARSFANFDEKITHFSTKEGKFLDMSSGEYVDLFAYMFGEEAEVYEIISGDETFEYVDGKIVGIDDLFRQNALMSKTLKIGTSQEYYYVDVDFYTSFIETIEDFTTLIDRRNYTEDVTGYYLLLNNLDFKGAKFTQIEANYDFIGAIDGDGHIISNLDLSGESRDNPGIGLFGRINGYNCLEELETCPEVLNNSLIVKDLAFDNIYLENGYLFAKSVKSYTQNWNGHKIVYSNPSLTNIYVRYSYDTVNPLGLSGNYGGPASLEMRNVIVDFRDADINESNTHPDEVIKGGYTQGCGAMFSNSYGVQVFYTPYSVKYSNSDVQKCSDNYLLSKYPIAYSTENALFRVNYDDRNAKTEDFGTRNGDGILYAENVETGFDGKPLTRQLGVDGSHSLYYTKCKGIYQFDDATDMAKNNTKALDSFNDCWTIINKVPVWKGLENNNAKVTIDDKFYANELSINEEAEFNVSVNCEDVEFTLESSNTNAIEVNGNKIIAKAIVDEPTEITVKYLVNGVEQEKVYTIQTIKTKVIEEKEVYFSTLDSELIYELEGQVLTATQYYDPLVSVEEKLPKVENVLGENYEGIVETIAFGATMTYNGIKYPMNIGKGHVVSKTCELYVETSTTIYEFKKVYVCTKAIDEAEDLKVFEVPKLEYAGQAGGYIKGTYELVNNIDATGITIEHNVFDTTLDPRSVGLNKIFYQGFAGYFDGNGYTISNLNTGKYGLFYLLSFKEYNVDNYITLTGSGKYGKGWEAYMAENNLSTKAEAANHAITAGYAYYHGYGDESYAPSIRNVAFDNVIADGPVLALHSRPANRTGTCYFEDIFVKYSADSTYIGGLVQNYNPNACLYNIVIDGTELTSYSSDNQGLLYGKMTTTDLYTAGSSPWNKGVFVIANIPLNQTSGICYYAENKAPNGIGSDLTADKANKTIVHKGLKQYSNYAEFKADSEYLTTNPIDKKGENIYYSGGTFSKDGLTILDSFEPYWTITDGYPVWTSLNN